MGCGVVLSTYMARKVNSKLPPLDMNAFEYFKMQILKTIVSMPDDSAGYGKVDFSCFNDVATACAGSS